MSPRVRNQHQHHHHVHPSVFEDNSDDLPSDVAFDLAMANDYAPDDSDAHPHDVEFDLAMFDETADAPHEGTSASTPRDVEFDISIVSDQLDKINAKAEAKSEFEEEAEIIGENLAATVAFKNMIAQRAAASQPVLTSVPKRPRLMQFDFSTGQVFGPAGGQTVITIRPQCKFRIEKVMATDTATPAGTGTSIIQIAIGQKIQKANATGNGSLTMFFAQNAIANGVELDTAQPWEDIAITVSFNQSCTFSLNFSGTAELE